MMKTVRVFVDRGNQTAITCPYCQKTSSVSVEKYKGFKHTLVTQCSCKQRFKVELNFRQNRRKNVKLIGEVLNISSNSNDWFTVTVTNLSMTGLRFKAIQATDIKKSHILRIRFTLDNQKFTQIEREAGVINIRDDHYGCEFLNLHYEKELGFYLRS